MHSGASTVSCVFAIIATSSSASSTSGMPALMSSMSAPAATCSVASTPTRERSPSRSSAEKSLRPVGLMRSPMMTNGCPAPIVTVLDRERMTVSMLLSFRSRRDAQPLAQFRDARVLAERDEVQPGDAGQRERVARLLVGDLEALVLLVLGRLRARDHLVGHLDARNVLADEAQRLRAAQDADRRQDRAALRHALGQDS